MGASGEGLVGEPPSAGGYCAVGLVVVWRAWLSGEAFVGLEKEETWLSWEVLIAIGDGG